MSIVIHGRCNPPSPYLSILVMLLLIDVKMMSILVMLLLIDVKMMSLVYNYIEKEPLMWVCDHMVMSYIYKTDQ